MHPRKYFILIITFLLFSSSFISAQISVSKIDASFDPGSSYGIIYALPRTIIRLDVKVEQKQKLAGPLHNYAEKYLGITDYIPNDEFEYSIKGVKLIPVSEADPEHYYFVKQSEKDSRVAWQTIMQLNGHGMITSLGTVSGEASGSSNAMISELGDDEVMEIFRMYADLNLYAKVDTIVRTINIDTITIEDYTFKTTMTNKPLEVKAGEVADMIHRIREGRYNLLTGYQEVNYSEGALRFMNDELMRLEEEYLRLFIGAVIKKELTYSFAFLPTMENSGNSVPVFSISEENGISDAGSGDQGFIRVESHGNTGAMQASDAREGGGLVYRIPENAIVKLIFQGNIIAQLSTSICQFGRVASLPPDVSDVEFDGETGGLRSIQLKAE